MFARHHLDRTACCAVFGTALLTAAVLSAVPLASSAWGAERDPTPQITAALPAEATVKPKQPRKLLVFTPKNDFHLQGALAGSKAIELMGRKTGAWATTISDDPAVFEAETLKGFDAVCFSQGTRINPFSPALPGVAKEERAAAEATTRRREEAFLAYVRGGKGVIGIHGAAACRSDVLLGVLGGQFGGHPRSDQPMVVRIDDPKHPLIKGFGGESSTIGDELYQFNARSHADFRKKLRVLLTLDVTRMTVEGNRADQDYAVAWVKKVGEGRVFHSTLGGGAPVFCNPKVLRFYQDGIQFALGDLEADTRPSAEVGIGPPPVAAPAPATKEKK
jgi:type 1 glutamine amidotransferase